MAASEQLALDLPPEPLDDAQGADQLPDGWRLLRLDAVCEINPSRKGRTNYADDLPVTFVPMPAIDEETGTIATPDVRPFGAVKKGYTWFIENDVLFAKITPCMQNGKAAIARGLSNGIGFGSTEFHVLRPGPNVLPDWLHFYVRQPSFRATAAQHFTGSVGQQRVPESFLHEQMLPVPPLPEQRRIVTRIEELAARIERARGLRREAAQEVEATLQRARLDTTESLHDATSPLGSLLREPTLNGLSQRPIDEPPGIAILRISSATSRSDGLINEADFKYLDVDRKQVVKYELEPGDLLACRFNGNLHYVGRFALYREYLGEQRVYPDKLIRFRIDTNRVMPEFVQLILNSAKSRAIIEEFCATTAGNIGISAAKLRIVPVPVPPLSEQQRIVAYLDGLQAKADAVKRLQAESAAELDALLPALLARAFRGEL